MNIQGYASVDNKPIEVIYRDGLKAVEYLFGNPEFAPHMSYRPEVVFNSYGSQEFTEQHTASYHWDIQVKFDFSFYFSDCELTM